MIDGAGCTRHLHIIRGATAAKSPCIRMRGGVASPCKVGGLIKLVLVEREQSESRPLFGGVGYDVLEILRDICIDLYCLKNDL